jgi:hypothetical protein
VPVSLNLRRPRVIAEGLRRESAPTGTLPIAFLLLHGAILGTSKASFPISSIWFRPTMDFLRRWTTKLHAFLEPLCGRFDQFVDLRSDHLFVRYCFAREQDAAAFMSPSVVLPSGPVSNWPADS